MSLPIVGIKTAYMPFADINQQPKSWKDSALGVIGFGTIESTNNATETLEIPTIQLPAPVLDGANIAVEIWLSHHALLQGKPLKNGQRDAIQYRLNDELLFGVISVPELGSLQTATESAYCQIFALMEALDYPHIYRFWNYMADINGISHGINGDLERYRQFNVGRKDAFLAYENGIGDQLPAACALGLADGPLAIAFLLGREAPIAIQNPRQINAYEYPDEYGPRTPNFSRATLLRTEQNPLLFISGTASIVGHLTLHLSNVIAQTNETLVNLEAVITEANHVLGEQIFNLHDIYFRVYIRHAADLSAVRNEMQRYIGGAIKAVFIQADICRQELLLEIEATAGQMLEISQAE
ncbi:MULTISPECIES: chorismate transformation enzyme, FkbO/Hyg5 family [Methylotenera]|uniref:chorismate transformation enzyme, FkbO/Hyg5 family n=1 Tax=Methylotenera TaxID=359407 RepID=UPI0003A77E62|nr:MULTISPECIES: hypothetical protein [Methylotenera]